jgi:hypothetical protein
MNFQPFYGRFTAETPHREADPRDYCPESEDAMDFLYKAEDYIRYGRLNPDERSNYIQAAITFLMKAHTAHLQEQKARRG